ncbi:unnamed protein product [Blepharisma stoltei]|uniref:Uncharacterized protein n=1 Tax=Blepharisma stoltei TaxID=1481888 RepID=A0AAU9J3R8_9CILI|nr:unnamed protein product [Blepharisma stoltei]
MQPEKVSNSSTHNEDEKNTVKKLERHLACTDGQNHYQTCSGDDCNQCDSSDYALTSSSPVVCSPKCNFID